MDQDLRSKIQDLRSKTFSLLFLLIFLLIPTPTNALDTPVTATVPDFSITKPVLQSPLDNTTTNTTKPSLVWKISSSSFPVIDYDLYLDDNLAAEGILHADGYLDSYFFTASRSGELITITPSYNLSGGYHQWYIVASNSVGNTAKSDTWEFLVDITPPNIIIRSLDNQNLNWSLDTPSSIPSINNRNLIATRDNPTIYVASEAFNSVKIDLVCPPTVQIFCANITSNFIVSTANWSYQIPHLFGNVTYTVFIQATDSGANTSVFPSFTVTLKPTQTINTPENIPTPPSGPIPPTPPREALELPKNPVSQFFESIAPPSLTQQISRLQKTTGLVPNLAIPVATVSLLAQFAAILSQLWYYLLHGVAYLMQYLGLWKKKSRLGFVYDAVTKQPLFLATVRLYKNDTKPKLIETDVTNKEGVFSFNINPGSYLVQVIKNNYRFPSSLVKGKNDGLYEHIYHGETITISDQDHNINVSIPTDPVNTTVAWKFKIVQYLRGLFKFSVYLSLGVGIISAIIAIIAGANIAINAILIIIYISISFTQVVINRQSPTWGEVTDQSGKTIPNLTLHLIETKFQRLVAIRNTDQNGRYQFSAPEGNYTIKIATPGFEFATGNKQYYSGETITIKATKPTIISPKIMVVTTK